ncbi:MAG: hypothetical protein IPP33_06200 [Flavobacteriales bacterium]|nr:hypothetical protein [Flavobacteriales bacterium]
MRRAVIVLLLLTILGGIAWWLLKWDGGTVVTADPWARLPVNTAVVVEVDDPLASWERFTSTSQWWTTWESSPGCAELDALVGRAREAADTDVLLKKAMSASSVLVSFSFVDDHMESLLVWAFPAEGITMEKLGPVFRCDMGRTSKLWSDGRISTLGADGTAAMHIGYSDGLLFISDSPGAVDGALLEPPLKSALASDSIFQLARASLGAGSDAHVLLHTERAQRLLTAWLRPEAITALNGISGWVALDARLRPEAFLFSGLLFNSSTTSILAAAQEQGVERMGIWRVLHPGVQSMLQLGISDPMRYCTSIIGEAPNEQLFEAYGSWVHGPIGVAKRASLSDSTHMEWAIMQAEDPLLAKEALEARCAGCDTLSYRNIRMMRSADTSALAAIWGPLFDGLERPWWCVLSDKVVFADQLNALRLSIDAWTDGYSLAQDARTSGFFQQYATEAGFTWWSDAAEGLRSFREDMKPAGARILLDHQNAWDHLGGCLLQVTPEEQGRFQITACLATVGSIANQVAHRNDTTTTTQNDGAMWSVSLGTHAQCGPWLITDHLSRTKQILVQDTKNRIALISCTGKLMWQRELDGPIMGGVHQVDKFKNGKLQMLFNTAERMYVIDRNGKDVERFPIRLPERASAPLNVFDYENKKEYRVLVPTEGSRLLNFDINGKPVDGWVPPKTIGVCEIPVEHMRIRGKDNLVLVDISGHINVFDRRGEPRYAPKLQARSVENFIGLVPAMDIGDCLLLWRDTEGNNLSGKFSGGLDTLRVQTASNGKTATEEMVAEGASPGDPLMAKGSIRYPSAYQSFSEKPRTLKADINLDGRPELITVNEDGKVEVASAP